jgi:hypothetical protein
LVFTRLRQVKKAAAIRSPVEIIEASAVEAREALIYPSFRPKHSGEPESSLIGSASDWIPACAGVTEK